MQRSHVLVVNSNIENSPCVIGEALCCGLPVIATAVGGIPELINLQNGILITPQSEEALKNAMLNAYHNYNRYNAEQIQSAAVQKFSAEVIAQQFHALYSRE